MNALAVALQKYFTTFARTQRDLSSNTIVSYRDTWRLLLNHIAKTKPMRPEAIDLDVIDTTHVTAFLDHLETERGNSVRTRNIRLGAIRAVLTQALLDNPEHAATITRVLAIPPKKHPKPVLEFLSGAETDALLAAPDRTTWTGRRDHAMLTLTIQTGLRISEIVTLTTSDITLDTTATVSCIGKGRKFRSTPLTSLTRDIMATYLAERANHPGQALFCGPHGDPLSRDAVERRLATHITTATTTSPSLANRKITMHSLRHTAAMNLLAAGIDIAVISLWMGHASTRSTDPYLHASMTIKLAAVDRIRPPGTQPGTYQPEPDILTWLNSL